MWPSVVSWTRWFRRAGQIVHEQVGELSVTAADEPIADQLAVSTNRRSTSRHRRRMSGRPCRRRVLFLGVAERPDFISTGCACSSGRARSRHGRQGSHSPASTSSFETVLMETSATREIDRMEEPSTSMERIWTRLFRGSLFMPSIYELLCLASRMPFGKSLVFRSALVDKYSDSKYKTRIFAPAKPRCGRLKRLKGVERG